MEKTKKAHLGNKMQLKHVQQNEVVFSGFSSWKWFRSFVSTVSKTQMKSQYTSLPPSQPIAAMQGGDIVLYEIIFG